MKQCFHEGHVLSRVAKHSLMGDLHEDGPLDEPANDDAFAADR